MTRERIAAAVARHLGGKALDPRLSILVEDDPDLADVSVIFIQRDGQTVGERRIGPIPCNDRSEPVALALLVAVDAVLLLPATKSSPPREPEEGAPPAALPPEPAIVAEAFPKFGASAQVLGLFGVVPKATVGVAAGLETALGRRFDVRLSAAAALPTRSHLGQGAVDVTWVSGRLDGCAVATPALSTRIRGCAGTAFGAFIANGRGFSPSYSAAPAWIAGILRGDVRFALTGALGLLLSAEAVIPFVRPDLEIADAAGTIADRLSVPVVGAIVGAGVDFR